LSLLCLAAEWIFPVSSPALARHAIEFEDGVIRAIRPARESDLYLPNTALLPGLINTHTHLAYTAMRNQFDDLTFFPWIRRLTQLKYQVWTPDDLALSTRLGILECLRAGITTVADLSDCETGLAELSKSPLRGKFYWELFGVEKEHAAKTWLDLQQTFPRLQAQYLTKRLTIGLSPHSVFTVRPELYRQVADWCLRDNIPVSFHLGESKEEEQFIADRSGPIAKFLEQRAADWHSTNSPAARAPCPGNRVRL
jgi:cytosine/adenosine deaminase-related metal-dependent hydrolase